MKRKDWIDKFVDELFISGNGIDADRLVLVRDHPLTSDLGGWCKEAIVTRLRAAVRKAGKKVPAE